MLTTKLNHFFEDRSVFMKKILFVLLGVALNTQAFALDWDGDLALTTSYRNDRLTTTANLYDPADNIIGQDKIKINGIDVYTVGLKGDVTFCDNIFITGFANWGWVGGGTYHERSAEPIVFDTNVKGHTNNGDTRDYSIGIGYLFSSGDCFRIGPVVGYAYDYQKVRLSSVDTNGIDDPILADLSYNMRWQGPWIGFATEYRTCDALFNVGYEFHWVDWRANWTLDGADVPGVAFSDKRKSDCAYGSVLYADSSYALCDCWSVGLGLKFQYWKAWHGELNPRAGSFVAVGGTATEEGKVPKATWCSIEIQLNAGYTF